MTDYLSIHKAAERMLLSDETVRDLCRRGELPGAFQEHERGPWKIPVETINDWITANTARRRKKRLTWAGISALILLVVALVSGLADWSSAREQLQQWGIISDIQRATNDEVLIVVFNFYTTSGVADVDIHGEIKRSIEAAAENNGLHIIRVEIDPRKLRADDRVEAEKIAEKFNASIVIWGEDTGTRVTVNFLNVREPDFRAADVVLSETELTQLANPSGFATFVTESIPNKFTFLSLFALGQSYVVIDDYQNATKIIQTAVDSLTGEEFIGLSDAYYYLAWLYQLTGISDLALQAANHAIELSPSPNAYNLRALLLMGQDSEAAIRDLEIAIQLEPAYALSYCNLGLAYYLTEDLDKAINYYSKAIEIDETFFAAYMNRGNIYDYQERRAEALDDFNRTVELMPQLADGYYNRAIVYRHLDNFEAAIEDFVKATELDPKFMTAYVLLGHLYSDMEKYSDAISQYTKALAVYPNNKTLSDFWQGHRKFGADVRGDVYYDRFIEIGEIYYNRGLAYYYLEQPDEALSDLNNAISYYLGTDLATPNLEQGAPIDILTDSFMQRGIIYSHKGNSAHAISDFTDAIARISMPKNECTIVIQEMICPEGKTQQEFIVDPYLAQLFNMRGAAKRNANDLHGAIEDYTVAMMLYGNQYIYYNNRSNAYRDLGEYQKSLDDLNIAIKLKPDDSMLFVHRAMTFVELKDFAHAMDDCDAAIRILPNNSEAYYLRGRIYRELGENKFAIQNFQKYLELVPNASDRSKVEGWIQELSRQP